MQGGKTYRSYTTSTSTQDTQCIYKDVKSFCKYLSLKLDKVISVHLFYTSQSYDVLDKNEADKFLIMLTKSTNKSLTSTFKKKNVFLNHLRNVALVRQTIEDTHHPFIPIMKGTNKEIVGFSINYIKGFANPFCNAVLPISSNTALVINNSFALF